MAKKDFLFQFDLDALKGQMEDIFREFLSLKGSFFTLPSHVLSPPTDVFETEDEIVVLLELPGVKKRDIQVLFGGNRVTVRAYRRDPYSGRRVSFRQMEIFNGPIERTVSLHEPVDEVNIRAHCENGLLAVSLPKKKRTGPTRIAVEKEKGGEEA